MLKSIMRICAFFFFIAAFFIYGYHRLYPSIPDGTAMSAFKAEVAAQINMGKTEFPVAVVFKAANLESKKFCLKQIYAMEGQQWAFHFPSSDGVSLKKGNYIKTDNPRVETEKGEVIFGWDYTKNNLCYPYDKTVFRLVSERFLWLEKQP